MSLGNFTKIPGKPKILRRQLKVYIIFFKKTKKIHAYNTFWEKSNCPDNLKIFQIFWKVSTQSGNVEDTLGTFQTIWKGYLKVGKFTDSM